MKRVRDGRPGVRPRPQVEALSAYRLRLTAPVKLNQNESPLDWPDELKAEVLARVAAQPWNRYPPVDAQELREELAAYCGVGPDTVAVANGSNEAILALVQAFATGRQVVLTVPGYSMSRTLASIAGAEVIGVPLRPDFRLDLDAMLDAAGRSDAAMVMIASPNNPTGNSFARRDIEAVLDGAEGLVVLDEAYATFATDSFLPDLRRWPNLAILRTCSKAFALAGARVGWIVAGEEIITAARKALPPYNLNVFAQQAALAALGRLDAIRERVAWIVRERQHVWSALSGMSGITPFPSDANFILFKTPWPGEAVFGGLLGRGVLVRDVSSVPMLERCLRVTIGSEEENHRFLAALNDTVEDLR